MGTEVINISFDVLQEELEKAKSNLKGLNDNIRRISGREPPDQLRGDRKRPIERRSDRDFNSMLDNRNRRSGGGDTSPQAKRKMEAKSVFSRLSGPPTSRDDEKPKLNSRIIRELPTKEEIVEAQGSDPASRARNRRMFGSLLGTLQKFCQEESRLKQKEEKKAQIEKKLEDQQNHEREIMKKERQCLYNNRKRQQLEIKMLENKMNVMKEFTMWENSKKSLMNFIRTKTKPRIYYLPKVLDKRTERKLEECKKDIEKQIEKKRAEVNEEVTEIVKTFETATEALYVSPDKLNESGQNLSLDQNIADNQSEDESYFNKSMTNNNNKSSHKRRVVHHSENGNESSNAGDDNCADLNEVSIKIEKDDEHTAKKINKKEKQLQDDDKNGNNEEIVNEDHNDESEPKLLSSTQI